MVLNLAPLLLSVLTVLPPADPGYFALLNKQVVEADVIKVEGRRTLLRVYVAGGYLERWYKLDEFAPRSAVRILKRVTPPGDPMAVRRLEQFAAEQAARRVHLANQSKVRREVTRARGNPRHAARAAAARAKRLRPAELSLARGISANRRGLLSSKSFSTAISHFKRAIQRFDRAAKQAASLNKRYKDDRDLVTAASRLQKQAQLLVQQSRLHLGSLYLTRGQFTSAMAQVNRTLLINPRNGQALGLRARIESAANNPYWGWGYGRRQ